MLLVDDAVLRRLFIVPAVLQPIPEARQDVVPSSRRRGLFCGLGRRPSRSESDEDVRDGYDPDHQTGVPRSAMRSHVKKRPTLAIAERERGCPPPLDPRPFYT